MFSLALALAFAPSAHAFCGTYVGGAGADLYNNGSQVALYRKGTETVLTMANDYDGPLDDFAMVVPVPQILTDDDVHVVDPTVFDRLDAYSAPRRVEYTCDDFLPRDDDTASMWMDGGSNTDSGSADTGGVTVEEHFIEGEYEIFVLSAEESSGLLTWLGNEGFSVGDDAGDLLQDYIDAGIYFLAAKVLTDKVGQADDDGRIWLSPLQLRYSAEAYGLPIRLGTLNSPGIQDIIVYALNPYSDGQVGIQNYPEFTIEDECMWQDDGVGFETYYMNEYTQAWTEGADGAGWNVEYSWGASSCDPCSSPPPEWDDLVTLGLSEDDAYGYEYPWLTRLHFRTTPEAATQDLMLYTSNITETSQVRFIDYVEDLESRFPVCGVGMVDDPGTCWFDEDDADDDDGGGIFGGDGGCRSDRSLAPLGLLPLFMLLGRRREEG